MGVRPRSGKGGDPAVSSLSGGTTPPMTPAQKTQTDRLAPPPAAAPGLPAGKRRGVDWAGIISKLGPILGLLVVFILFAVLRPGTFATFDNVELILLQTAVVGSAALGTTLVIL